MINKISIIIPALNESAGINETIEHLNGLITATGTAAEIIVVVRRKLIGDKQKANRRQQNTIRDKMQSQNAGRTNPARF